MNEAYHAHALQRVAVTPTPVPIGKCTHPAPRQPYSSRGVEYAVRNRWEVHIRSSCLCVTDPKPWKSLSELCRLYACLVKNMFAANRILRLASKEIVFKRMLTRYGLLYGAGLSLTTALIFLSYATRSFLNRLYASACAGDSGFGSLRRS